VVSPAVELGYDPLRDPQAIDLIASHGHVDRRDWKSTLPTESKKPPLEVRSSLRDWEEALADQGT
jgi:hypothetical protein